MNIQKLKLLSKISCILLIVYLLISCEIQKGMQVKRIIKGVLVEGFHNYSFCDDINSVYFIGKDTISVHSISEYDDTGNLTKFSVYKPEGVLEYLIDDLMEDTLMFQFSGGKSVKDWKIIGNNNITNNIDTLKIETTKNNLGMNILINRKGNKITIFEL